MHENDKNWRVRPGLKESLAPQIDRFGWRIGAHSYGHPQIYEPDYAGLTIGRFVSIGPNVTLILGNHNHSTISTYPFATLREYWPSAPEVDDHFSRGDIIIGNDVWVGANATIMSGVHIGDGAVIAAGALITKDVAPYDIVGGQPARVIKARHSPDIVAELLTIEWWDWPDETIDAMLPLILSTDVNAFINAAKSKATEHGSGKTR